MLPNTAMPTALPSVRMNMLLPVTTPRLLQPTTEWTATTVATEAKPRPTPSTKLAAATRHTPEPPPTKSASSRQQPTAITPPSSAVGGKSIRRYTRGAIVAAIGQPIVIAAIAKPATTAPTPTTRCAYVGTYDDWPIRIAPIASPARLHA